MAPALRGATANNATAFDTQVSAEPVGAEPAGEKSLENIDRPVHVYQIQASGTRARLDWLGAGLRQYRRLAPALGLVILLAGVAGIGAWRFWPRETMNSDGMPTVAVLPFVVEGNNPAPDDFARGLTGEVSAYLSTFPDMHTLAISDPAAKLAARNQPRQSKATYLLEGDVAKADGKTHTLSPPDGRWNGGATVVQPIRF